MSRSVRCGFIPPFLLEHLASSGVLDAQVFDTTLELDAELRARRLRGDESPRTPIPSLAGIDLTSSPGPRWTVHTARNLTSLPGSPVRREGDPAVTDPAVNEAGDGVTASLDLLRDGFGRTSYDGRGAHVSLTVHYGRGYANAFWDGEQLVFGDGDGVVFRRFTSSVDVLAHELAHAVTERMVGLVYRGQSGALNESVSDVFAACVKQQVRGQSAATGDWLIGDGLFAPGVSARALRDMANPGTAYDDPRLGRDPQPGHMDDYVVTREDNGGVHINSGIPNRAFVLAARAIDGSTAEGAGRIWYAALASGEIGPASGFEEFAAATVAAAGPHHEEVRQAWVDVGVMGRAGFEAPSDRTSTSGAGRTSTTGGDGPGVVRVRRTGGVTGIAAEGWVDCGADDDPRAAEVRELVALVDLREVPRPVAHPDRFVYSVQIGNEDPVELWEQALTPPLQRLVAVVLRGA